MFSATIVAEPVLRCPFNRTHTIAKSRIQKHIVKCEKHYPSDYKVMCPYDATHRVFGSEITEHIFTCSAKMTVDPEFHTEPKQHGSLNFALCSEISSTIDCTENWDLDIDTKWRYGSDVDSVSRSASVFGMDLDDKELRPPLGYSEAAMKDVDDESFIEDCQSIVSEMAAGRGSLLNERQSLFRKMGRSRGRLMH